jgi:hypothetical protein
MPRDTALWARHLSHIFPVVSIMARRKEGDKPDVPKISQMLSSQKL